MVAITIMFKFTYTTSYKKKKMVSYVNQLWVNNNNDDDYVDTCNLSFSIKVTREAVDDPMRMMRAASV